MDKGERDKHVDGKQGPDDARADAQNQGDATRQFKHCNDECSQFRCWDAERPKEAADAWDAHHRELLPAVHGEDDADGDAQGQKSGCGQRRCAVGGVAGHRVGRDRCAAHCIPPRLLIVAYFHSTVVPTTMVAAARTTMNSQKPRPYVIFCGRGTAWPADASGAYANMTTRGQG